MLLIFLIPAGLTFTFGRMVRSSRQGWALFAAMSVLFFIGVAVCYWAEAHPNAALHSLATAMPAAADIQLCVASATMFEQ